MPGVYDAWVERARAVPIESEIIRRGIKLRRSGSERIGPCPRCGGDDRFSINVKEGVWNCRQCKPADVAGDVIGLVEWLDNTDFNGACTTLAQEPMPSAGPNGKGNGGGTPQHEVAWYDYTDVSGKLIFQVVRFGPEKDFRQRKPVPGGGWDWSVRGVRPVPFNWPALDEALGNQRTVYIVEGEKDVKTLERYGVVATTNAGGAGKWRPELNEYFRDADVVIIADFDPQSTNKKTGEKLFHDDGRPRIPGLDHGMHVAAELKPIALDVRMFVINALWPECPPKGDITDYFEAGGTVEALHDFAAKLPSWTPGQADKDAAPPTLPLIDIRGWEGLEPSPRRWLIAERIPDRNVTLLSGQGGVGKTLLMQQLSVATVLGADWIGLMPEFGPVLFITAEDDVDEMHFRYHAIAKRYGVGFADLAEKGLSLLSLAGRDAAMAVADARGIVKPTELFHTMVRTARLLRPRWIGLDTAADIFVVNERDRSQVRQCISLLRGIALELHTAVILLSHPSLTGISSGSGLSGSTAWNNSVRSRLYLKSEKPKSDDDDAQDVEHPDAVRVLEFMKSNYSALAPSERLIWRNGLFEKETATLSVPERAAQEANAKAVFLAVLERRTRQNLLLSHKDKARNYAPHVIAGEPEAASLAGKKSHRKDLLQKAMDDLLRHDRIHIGRGPLDARPSKQSDCLLVTPGLLV